MIAARGPERRRRLKDMRTGDRLGDKRSAFLYERVRGRSAVENLGRALRSSDIRRCSALETERAAIASRTGSARRRPRRHRGRLRAALHGERIRVSSARRAIPLGGASALYDLRTAQRFAAPAAPTARDSAPR